MVNKKYKVIWKTPIHVELQQREPEEIFEAKPSTEIKNLVLQKYIEEYTEKEKTTEKKTNL